MNIPAHIYDTLTDEQKKKVEAVQTPEELIALAKEYGHELTADQLEDAAGGWCFHCGYNCFNDT